MQVLTLAVQHAGYAQAFFHVFAGGRLLRGRGTGQAVPEQCVGAIHQSQCGQHRGCLAMGTMDTRLAAALGGVVHAGKIVKDQRRGVKIFNRHRQLGGTVVRQFVATGQIVNQPGSDQTARPLQNLLQRAPQMGFGFRRQRQAGGKGGE